MKIDDIKAIIALMKQEGVIHLKTPEVELQMPYAYQSDAPVSSEELSVEADALDDPWTFGGGVPGFKS